MPTATQSPPVRSLAVVRALAGIGDMLCVIPALRSLRAGMPDAHITLVGLSWAKVLIERFPAYVDELVVFPGFPGIPEVPPAVEALPGFLERMQARRFDLALQMQGSGYTSNPFTLLLGARSAAGFCLPGQYVPGDGFIPYPADRHEALRMTALTASLGMPDTGTDLEWPVTDADREELRQSCAGLAAEYAIVHAGAADPLRRWSPEGFAAVADRLSAEGLQVVLTGVGGDRAIASAVRSAMKSTPLDLCARTSLGAFGALVDGARLVVCNDTGISHIAAARKAPSVVVFSASDPGRWAPLDTALHSAVYRETAADACEAEHGAEERCLKDGCRKLDRCACALEAGPVPVESVLAAVEERLAKEDERVA